MNLNRVIYFLILVLLSSPLHAMDDENPKKGIPPQVSKLRFGSITCTPDELPRTAVQTYYTFEEYPRAYYGACVLDAPELELYELGKKIVASREDEARAKRRAAARKKQAGSPSIFDFFKGII